MDPLAVTVGDFVAQLFSKRTRGLWTFTLAVGGFAVPVSQAVSIFRDDEHVVVTAARKAQHGKNAAQAAAAATRTTTAATTTTTTTGSVEEQPAEQEINAVAAAAPAAGAKETQVGAGVVDPEVACFVLPNGPSKAQRRRKARKDRKSRSSSEHRPAASVDAAPASANEGCEVSKKRKASEQVQAKSSGISDSVAQKQQAQPPAVPESSRSDEKRAKQERKKARRERKEMKRQKKQKKTEQEQRTTLDRQVSDRLTASRPDAQPIPAAPDANLSETQGEPHGRQQPVLSNTVETVDAEDEDVDESNWRTDPTTAEATAEVDKAIRWIETGTATAQAEASAEHGDERDQEPDHDPMENFGYKRPYEVIAAVTASKKSSRQQAGVPLPRGAVPCPGDRLAFQVLEQDETSFLPVLSPDMQGVVRAYEAATNTVSVATGHGGRDLAAFVWAQLANVRIIEGPSLNQEATQGQSRQRTSVPALASHAANVEAGDDASFKPRGVQLSPEQEKRAMSFFARCDDAVPRKDRMQHRQQQQQRPIRRGGRGRGRGTARRSTVCPGRGIARFAASVTKQQQRSNHHANATSSSKNSGGQADIRAGGELTDILRMIAAQRYKMNQRSQ